MTTEEKFLPYLSYIALLCIVLSLVPWLINFLTYAINVDIAFLTLSAERLLSGEMMSEAYYDTNLPLSIIVQIPPVLLSSALDIPLYHATSVYIFILLGLSLFSTNLLLKKFDDLSVEQRVIILSAFLVMNTLKPGYDFGQKDHILGLALFPLALAQILITKRIEFNKILKMLVILAGSFLILLKPHYGLVPAAIFLHRVIYQKRFSVFLDIDFIFLAGMAVGYIGAIFIFFPDFISVILPDILQYYASDISPSVVQIGIILIVQALVPLAICQIFLKKAPPLISVFSLMAAICFVPFIMQGKGWAYHAIPADIFMYSSFGLFIHFLVNHALTTIKLKNNKNLLSFTLVMFLVAAMVVKETNSMPKFPTHKEYINSELAKIINKCTGSCSFFLFNEMINIAPELSVYTKQPHASRFPVLWFLPDLLHAQKMIDQGEFFTPMSQQELNTARQKYMSMVLKDLNKYQPDIMIIGHFNYSGEEGDLFDFKQYTIESNPEFEILWDSYTLERSIDIDRIEYMIAKLPNEDLIRYDIYRKKKPQETKE